MAAEDLAQDDFFHILSGVINIALVKVKYEQHCKCLQFVKNFYQKTFVSVLAEKANKITPARTFVRWVLHLNVKRCTKRWLANLALPSVRIWYTVCCNFCVFYQIPSSIDLVILAGVGITGLMHWIRRHARRQYELKSSCRS